MDYLGEVKNYVTLHARAQGVGSAQCRKVLGSIHTFEDDEAGWARVWTAAADRCREDGRVLDAIARDNLARFPFPATPLQEKATARAAFEFGRWAKTTGSAENLAVEYAGARTTAWFASVPSDEPAPLVVIVGGIVSPKEQWGRLLPAFRRLGIAALAVDLPGAGAHRDSLYGPDSEKYVSAVVDAAAARMRISGVYGLAMSYGGTVMLRAAAEDPRLRGVVTVGAPIQYSFTDPIVLERMPEITRRTLSYVTGSEDLGSLLPALALTDRQLDRLVCPVHYVRSLRDEIVPREEAGILADHLADLSIVDFDDVHGSPHHTDAVRVRVLSALVDMIRPGAVTTRVLSGLLSVGAAVSLVSPFDVGRRVAS